MADRSGVGIWRQGAVGRIRLARGGALNALTPAMVAAMTAALLEWWDDDTLGTIILDHDPAHRGFCAGGDVAWMRRQLLAGERAEVRRFFRDEYRLNHLLHTCPKRLVCFMDGPTMGGGVGLALPCLYRIATENTALAMPEGSIGLFPDVGTGWYLPRLPHHIGAFLALTGARLDGAECLWAGLATHYLPAAALEDAIAAITADPDAIEDVLERLAAEPPPARLAGNAEKIERLFAGRSLTAIRAALAADDSRWAGKELAAVDARCPTSAAVALRLFATQVPDFAAQMAQDYRIAIRMIDRPDFAEGVRAVLVDKEGEPLWQPPPNAAELEALFAPLADGAEWTPL
ncbi:enoyl-CoA hydratase/isomerase family protein [Croceibacterium sp. TMG7-5b_MA50]|uniref:enoyl-CoA hydratase/isomerase family protein n=1 Tax=Croceibacterium sp. TMG7-5b_MA50 TaxID=3121290 RepID=UPI003221A002